jgi:hypothetical protein
LADILKFYIKIKRMKMFLEMQQLRSILITLLILMVSQSVFGQSFPFGFNYQAVVRDANGSAKATTTVGVRISIVSTSSTGPTVFQEIHTTTTNALGQLNITIGSGVNTNTPGGLVSFSLIPWHTDIFFIRSEVQMGVSPTFTQIGTVQQLMAVPYALHARTIPPSITRYTAAGTGTYTTPPGTSYLKIRMVGGGGGGSLAQAPGNGTSGQGTTFGTNLLIANGGGGGTYNAGAASGGSTTVNSPAISLVQVNGSDGSSGSYNTSPGPNQYSRGPSGGVSYFGGAGGGGGNIGGFPATSAKPNSGSGGGGGCVIYANVASGSSGAAGGYVEALIYSPNQSYSYSVGAGGTGAGTGGDKGGDGGSGVIIIEAHY